MAEAKVRDVERVVRSKGHASGEEEGLAGGAVDQDLLLAIVLKVELKD